MDRFSLNGREIVKLPVPQELEPECGVCGSAWHVEGGGL